MSLRFSSRRRRSASALAAVLGGALGVLGAAPDSTVAAPSAPVNLTASDGGRWQVSNRFSLSWSNPPASPNVTAVHYRVRNSLGATVVPEDRLNWAATSVDYLAVPSPGAYTAEVWLEDTLGSQGPAASAVLHFDNLRPATAEPVQPLGWLGRTAAPFTIHLSHPGGQPPPSGILGYAVSVDMTAGASPCAGTNGCTADETDLRGGIEDDELTISALAEGTNYVHAVAVSGAGVRSSTIGQAIFLVDLTDPVTSLTGVPSGWSSSPVRVTASASDAGAGMEPGPGVTPFTAIQIDDGAPVVGEGATVRATVIGEGIHNLLYYARDAAGNINDGDSTNGIPNKLPSSAVVRIDRTPPGVSFARTQDPDDPELIRVGVSDGISGPDLSHGWIGVRRAGSGERFEPLELGPGADALQARWDSDAFPPGRYEFRATGYDLAGNATTTGDRAGGEAMVLTNPLKATTTLSVGLLPPEGAASSCERRGSGSACRRPRQNTARPASDLLVPFGASPVFAGKLTTETGAPTGGANIRIVERFASGADSAERVSSTSVNPDGSFALPMPSGPTRQVTVSFAGSRTLGRSAGGPVQLRVASEVELRVSATIARVGGKPVIFRGSVTGSGCAIPANGKTVQLQFRLPGHGWTEFRSVQTDRRGNFRYPYRFSDDDSRGVRFQFRAFAPAQSDWPYEPAGSRPVAVRGV